jgi:hypothetical protein
VEWIHTGKNVNGLEGGLVEARPRQISVCVFVKKNRFLDKIKGVQSFLEYVKFSHLNYALLYHHPQFRENIFSGGLWEWLGELPAWFSNNRVCYTLVCLSSAIQNKRTRCQCTLIFFSQKPFCAIDATMSLAKPLVLKWHLVMQVGHYQGFLYPI